MQLRRCATRVLLVLSWSAMMPKQLDAASGNVTGNTICQLSLDCPVAGHACLPPPSGTEKYAGAGNSVCRCPDNFKAGVGCAVTCDGGIGNACSGHGECMYARNADLDIDAGSCNCDYGWVGMIGSQCSVTCSKGSSDKICSGHGVCTATVVGEAVCNCEPGFRGKACEIECPGGHATPCSGHGKCMSDGTCACHSSWKTSDCSIGCPGQIGYDGTVPCLGHGTCTEAGFCDCDVRWRGPSCNLPCPALHGVPCAGNGVCNDAAQCLCNKGFLGASCSIECRGGAQNPCNGNGVCQADGSCKCSHGWVGGACEILCPGGLKKPCMDRGTCYAEGQYSKCRCSQTSNALVSGYVGEMCETPVYNNKKRDANATKVDNKAFVFRNPEAWPALLSPLVMLGIAVVLVTVSQVFKFIDKRVAQARERQEAINLASQQQSFKKGDNIAAAKRQMGATRSKRNVSQASFRAKESAGR